MAAWPHRKKSAVWSSRQTRIRNNTSHKIIKLQTITNTDNRKIANK